MATLLILVAPLSSAQDAASEISDYLPVNRTLTDTAGRKIEATITAKTDTSVKFRRRSDSKEFELELEKLSPQDREFVKAIGKPGPIEKTEIEITISGSSVKVTRLGNGPLGVVFFGHSGSSRMKEAIMSDTAPFSGLLPDRASFFLWEYPETGPFAEVSAAIEAYRGGDQGKIRPNFKGIASDAMKQIREKSGLEDFLLVGNSLGAGIVLWDFKDLVADPKNSFLLISPTETFMPPVSELGKPQRTMLLSSIGRESPFEQTRDPDPFLGGSAKQWVMTNLDTGSVKNIIQATRVNGYGPRERATQAYVSVIRSAFERGHAIIGDDIPNNLLSRIIRVKLGINPVSALTLRNVPYSLENPYSLNMWAKDNGKNLVTSLKRTSKNVVKIIIPTGETAVIEMTNVDGYDLSGENVLDYRWKYRAAPGQPVQTGKGTAKHEFVDIEINGGQTHTIKPGNNSDDSILRAGGISILWTDQNVLRHFASHGSVDILPPDSFEKDF